MSETGGDGGGEKPGGPESDITAEELTDILEVGLCLGIENIFDFLTQLGDYKPTSGGGAPHH